MAADILALLIRLNLAAGLAIVIVMVLRTPTRRLFGPGHAYALWLAAPLASAAALLPARPQSPLVPPGLPIETVARVATHWAAPSRAIAAPTPTVDVAALLLVLWLFGAAIGLVAVALLHRRSLMRLGRLHTTGDPGLLRSDTVWSGPAVIGALRPRIVLPADFEDRFTALEQAVVLTHERVHLARADAVINSIVVLIQCVSWMNPLVHFGARLLRLDQEMACDSAVIGRHPEARRAYAQAMLKTQLAPVQSPLGCYWPAKRRNPLKERFAMLKMRTPSRRRRYFGTAAISMIVAGAGCGAWASSDEVRAATQEIVEVTASPAPGLAKAERAADGRQIAGPAAITAAEAGRAKGERPLTDAERNTLQSARAALARSYEQHRLGVDQTSALAAQAAHVAELELQFGQKPAAADEALRLAQAEFEHMQQAAKIGAVEQSEVGRAAERLLGLQLAFGRQPTAADETLRLAQADLERAQQGARIGVVQQSQVGVAAERLLGLQLALGRQATAADEALRAAQADLERSQQAARIGVGRQSDVSRAAERLFGLQLALGRETTALPVALDAARKDLAKARADADAGLRDEASLADAAARVAGLESLDWR